MKPANELTINKPAYATKSMLLCMVVLSMEIDAKLKILCGNNETADKLVQLIMTHQKQQRSTLVCNPTLNKIAEFKAGIIVDNQMVWHNAGHMTPNQLLRHQGFKLPETYPVFGNQVEALAGGESNAVKVFNGFLNSEPHRKLLLGEDAFFKSQDQIGAAFIKDMATDHQYYWVIIIADEKENKIKQDPVIDVKPPVVSKNKRNRGREIKEKLYKMKIRRS